ncbi:MAG: type IX secretion system sortase PorU [Saprospiraceae bacterium]|nr:type IX secretion system sortase PorU [Saprospiraceae bacterium]
MTSSRSILLIFISVASVTLFGQSKEIVKNFSWSQEDIQIDPISNELMRIYTVNDGHLSRQHPEIPLYSDQVKLGANYEISIQATITKSSPITINTQAAKDHIQDELNVWTTVEKNRNDYFLVYGFIPVVRSNSGYIKVEEVRLTIDYGAPLVEKRDGPTFADNSVLASGAIYKVSFTESGVYKLDYNYLKDLGIDIDNINPKNLAVYTSHGKALAENIIEDRFDDLIESPILIKGEENNVFNSADYILFYAKGDESWNTSNNTYNHEKNIYSDINYAFIKVKESQGKRLGTSNSLSTTAYTSSIYNSLQRYEEDKVNLLAAFTATQGTGQLWFGDRYNTVKEYDYTDKFDLTGYVLGEEIEIKLGFAGRNDENTSRVFLDLDGNTLDKSLARINDSGSISTNRYANYALMNTTTTINNPNGKIVVRYPFQGNDVSEGWLDYLQLIIPKTLNFNGNPILISNQESVNYNNTALSLTGSPDHIWDVTSLDDIKNAFVDNGQIKYNSQDELRLFYAFNEATAMTPTKLGVVENQNLHSIDDVELIVIYHPTFENDIERYVEHRSSFGNLNVKAVNINHVYNEFSGGKVDPSAIRDLAKMVYDRTDNFKYLLLIGDGSFDYKQLTPDIPDHNFIPAYETKESLDPIDGFPTDDFYALLDINEGTNLKGQLDIAVGRFPVKTAEEFTGLVDKLIHYDTHPDTQGDWKLKLGFAADDEDSGRHLTDTEDIANQTKLRYPDFNQQKIYFDAFLQESTPGGARFPDATKELNNAVFKGLLVLNYLGHGGPKGWAQERVLQVSDIQSWNNYDNIPLLITATCTFAGYDEPSVESAGEVSLLNERGGAIGLFSTTRAVFASDNKRLVSSVYDTMFTTQGGQLQTLGEILMRGKNKNVQDTQKINARKFSLLGDPSMRLSVPLLNVETSKINGTSISEFSDTLKALEQVTIDGIITDQNNQFVSDYNGIVYPTIFDKESTLRTLANDSNSGEKSFNVIKNILFKGAATVTNGMFSFTFVVPKDINYAYGPGRISYYATNPDRVDAKGSNDDFIIGGTSNNIIQDNQGPEIQIFMNDESFVFGGITNTDPVLLIKLEDENGINVTGTSIGHDLSGTLDEDNQGTFIMNDFYEATVDNFREGSARYPISGLESGRHSISVKAWDVLNNSSEARSEFVVIKDGDNVLEHVLNYPNPFTTSTNFQFEHDLTSTELDILITIYTISGKVIKTIEATKYATGFRIDDIHWDGTDDFGSDIGKGVYLYKIKVRSDEFNLLRESEFEKLVILK